ncbi:MAG: M1 family metallopeptidase, partial [Candidatus Omnitrophica bacterium]|nr:M1 family metallopeptidase [Candidatus Omnitrophota bacterium]
MRTSVLVLATLLQGTPLLAQRPVPYPVVPPPQFQRAVAKGTRSQTGEPGRRYWQQWTRYDIRATLAPDAKRLSGSERVVYFNRSPDTLSVLYLHLYQNLHAPGVPRNEPAEVTGGVQLESVAADGQPVPATTGRPGYRVDGTIMRLSPPEPVAPGDSIVLDLAWGFQVPQQSAGRMGWNGDNLFFVAYWYPRLAVYDDVEGWQADPYLSSAEFYDGYGDYDFAVDVPEGWVVTGTGELVNPDEVLPDAIVARLRNAEQSDQVISILGAGDLGPGKATRTGPTGRLTWRYRAQRVRDVAFAATSASLWDAARTPVGDRDGDGTMDYTRVDALYRASATLWRHAARYAQHAITHHSSYTGLPYAWSHMSAVEGGGIISGGMEFPMMTLIDDYRGRSDSALYYVVSHELGHMWVPMMVGTDERRYGWMDEGTTTFNENHASNEFFPGRNADRGDQSSYLAAAKSGYESEMMRWTDYLYPNQNGTASYAKPATVLVALRGLLGDTLFRR